LWLHSLKVAQLLRSAACLHTNQSRSYLNHLVYQNYIRKHKEQEGVVLNTIRIFRNVNYIECWGIVSFHKPRRQSSHWAETDLYVSKTGDGHASCVVCCRGLNWVAFSSVIGCCKTGWGRDFWRTASCPQLQRLACVLCCLSRCTVAWM